MKVNKENIASMKAGNFSCVDMVTIGSLPLPEERACLLLAEAYQTVEDPDFAYVSWVNQERAAEFYNRMGLSETLDAIRRIAPWVLEPPI